jgi:hypothetical protein
MALIDGLRAAASKKGASLLGNSGNSETVSEIPEFLNVFDVSPEKFTPEYARTVLARVGGLIEGKTVTELYQEFGIIKPRHSSDDEILARRKRAEDAARNPRDQKEVQLLFAMDLFEDVDKRLQQWAHCIKEIEDSDHVEKALGRLVTTLEELTGCTVRLERK